MDKHEAKEAARLDALETEIAYLRQVTDDLSDVIARQDRVIDRLSRRLSLLMEAEAERQADGEGSVPVADQRPPHY